MDIIVVRHAIAFERDPSRWPDDADRPLTSDGEDRFRAAARGLGRLVPKVDVVFASPFARAWRTAELLQAEIKWPAPRRCDELSADRPASAVLVPLRDERGARSVAVVGHEPGLSELASLLLTGDPDGTHLDLKKGGVIRISVDDGIPASGMGLLRWALPPKALRALRS
jgi:phosphohistidine phosphatase